MLKHRYTGMLCYKILSQSISNNVKIILSFSLQKISVKYAESPWLIAACSPEFENAAIFLNTILKKQSVNEKIYEKILANIEEACVVMTLIDTLKEVRFFCNNLCFFVINQ